MPQDQLAEANSPMTYTRNSGARRFNVGRVRRLGADPLDAGMPVRALLALYRGDDVRRRLTRMERIALAVAGARPDHVLGVSSRIADRSDFLRRLELFRLHVARRTSQPKKPLVYFGAAPTLTEREAGMPICCCGDIYRGGCFGRRQRLSVLVGPTSARLSPR